MTEYHPLTKEEAQKVVEKTHCHSKDCELTEKEHQIFYKAEIRKLTGNEEYWHYDNSCSPLDIKESLEEYKTTHDEYGNPCHYMRKIP